MRPGNMGSRVGNDDLMGRAASVFVRINQNGGCVATSFWGLSLQFTGRLSERVCWNCTWSSLHVVVPSMSTIPVRDIDRGAVWGVG